MMAFLEWLIATPLACASGYLIAKVFALDGLAKWISAKIPLLNKLPWVKPLGE